MKSILSERNIVVVLFVMVLITFSLAQEDSKKKMTNIYTDAVVESASLFLGQTIANPTVPEKSTLSPRK